MIGWVRILVAIAALVGLTGGATEQDKADCIRGATDAKLRGCTAVIEDPKVNQSDRALSYTHRGIANLQRRNADAALSDLNESIRLNPQPSMPYAVRGSAFLAKGDADRALRDFEEAERKGNQSAQLYLERGRAYSKKGDNDRAIGDFNRAIQKNDKMAAAYANRGGAYARLENLNQAIANYEEAIRLGLRDAALHYSLGQAYARTGAESRAIVQFEEAIRLRPNFPSAYNARGEIHEKQNRRTEAIDDYQHAIGLPSEPNDIEHERGKSRARANHERLAAAVGPSIMPPKHIPGASTQVGRRVALIIGNSKYSHAGVLDNPVNDAKAISAALKRLGFQVVRERLDLTYAAFNRELKLFSDVVEGADWAVIYFAGHGLEIGGKNYLLPIDAELASDRHLEEEAVNMTRLLEKLEPASELRLVILDACRNNPFIGRMAKARQLTRSVNVGLAPIVDTGGVLVAYAARAGTVALDGTGKNSPFAEALVAHLEEPGLEINFLFRKVRDQVLRVTNRKQEPWTYGTLPAKSLVFKSR